MKKQIIGALVAVAGMSLPMGCATEQTPPECIIVRGDYAAKYTLVGEAVKSGPSAAIADCDTLKGEVVGAQRYKTADGKAFVALKPSVANLAAKKDGVIGNLVTENKTQPWGSVFASKLGYDLGSYESYAYGQFPENDTPNAQGVCEVSVGMALTKDAEVSGVYGYDPVDSNFVVVKNADGSVKTDAKGNPVYKVSSTATMNEALDAAQPWTTATGAYTFENYRTAVSARSPGQTWAADITYTETWSDGTTCTAKYKAVALAPAIGCETDVDCDPCADVAAGRFTGSGINPDIKTTCDTSIGMCVVAGDEIPGFMSDAEIDAAAKECAARSVPQ